MNQEILATNLATVQIHFDAEKAGNWERIKTMYTEDIIWERACMNQIVKGKEAVAAAYVEVFSALRNWDFQCLDRFATEDRVVDETIFTFEIAKEGAMPLPVGTKAKLRLVHIFEMRDGKVSRELVMETPPQPV
ncbi:MAG: nuclear transport factor 2 family protein [Deltaproteobacteria bacterium]|nr:nuclear transport factor 2 family protein [Deltaproteobacteria bacterium]